MTAYVATPRFWQRLKVGVQNAHMTHKLNRHMSTTLFQRASGLCGHDPQDPPLKYYIVRFCKVLAARLDGRFCGIVAACLDGRLLSAWRGEGRADGQGPQKRRGRKQNFLLPTMPTSLKLRTCLKAYLLHRARSKRLRRV
jgi:hypothetical protein